MSLLNAILRLFGFRRIPVSEARRRTRIGIVLAAFILGALLVPAPASAAPPPPLPPECLNLAHHTPSHFLQSHMTSGLGQAWTRANGDLIYAVQVAECGGLLLVGIWRSGSFQTNFFPKIDLYTSAGRAAVTRAAWNYVKGQIRGLKAVRVPAGFGGGIYWPYTFRQTGKKFGEGCWLGADGKAAPEMNRMPELQPFCNGLW